MFARMYKEQVFLPITIIVPEEQQWQKDMQDKHGLTAEQEDTTVISDRLGTEREDIIESFVDKDGKIAYWHLVNDTIHYGLKVFWLAENLVEAELQRKVSSW